MSCLSRLGCYVRSCKDFMLCYMRWWVKLVCLKPLCTLQCAAETRPAIPELADLVRDHGSGGGDGAPGDREGEGEEADGGGPWAIQSPGASPRGAPRRSGSLDPDRRHVRLALNNPSTKASGFSKLLVPFSQRNASLHPSWRHVRLALRRLAPNQASTFRCLLDHAEEH